VIQVALALIMIAAVLNEVLGVGKASRKSPAAYRLERAAYRAKQAAKRYAAIPPMVKAIDQEKRWKKARRSALAAVSWALLADQFNRDEIAGAVVKVLSRNRNLVFDHETLHRECLIVLKAATNQ
jgi:hypothetical protein